MLFIDEIHRLSPAVEEVLYPAMEDFQLDLIIGEGPAARSVKIDLSKFTLVGATTRAGLLTNPLRDRFGIPIRLNFYTIEELESIVTRGARVLNVGMSADGANEIARRARGTPRIAGRLLRRVRDFASAADADRIDRKIADHALSALEVDAAGLDAMDRRYLMTIAQNYGGGPVGEGHREAARALAADLAAGPTFGNAMTKRMLEMEWAMSVETAIEAEAVAQALCMTTEDFARAYRAFAAKQKPVFEGN